MVVCFSIGSKSKAIINTMSVSADNVEFQTYNSIKDIIKDATLRHIDFKRIVISTSILSNKRKPEKELTELSKFISDYSASTEVVLILGSGDIGKVDTVFNSIFNAPMYTPVLLPKATVKSLLELVTADIMSIRVKYYELDKNTKAEEPVKETEVKPADSIPVDTIQTDSNPPQNTQSGFSSGPVGLDVQKYGNQSSNLSGVQENAIENPGVRNMSETSPDSIVSQPENLVNDDDDDLSLGDFGQAHSDTGFLDDADSDPELKAFMEAQENQEKEQVVSAVSNDINKEVTSISQVNEKAVTPVKNTPSPQSRVRKSESLSPKEKYEEVQQPHVNSNIDLVISNDSTRATRAMLDEALSIYQRDKARVLIVDLDVKSNRILSYIDASAFYRSNCAEGISKQKVYKEGGVDICSNGYGVPVSLKDFNSLFNSRLIRSYDLVLVDCPVGCLNLIDSDYIKMCHVLIYTGGSCSNLIEMSRGLTDRSIVALTVEKYIMRNCDVEIDDGVQRSDLETMRQNFIFANGSWLNKITNVYQ